MKKKLCEMSSADLVSKQTFHRLLVVSDVQNEQDYEIDDSVIGRTSHSLYGLLEIRKTKKFLCVVHAFIKFRNQTMWTDA